MLQKLKFVTGGQIYRHTLKGIADLLLLNWKFLTGAHFVTGAHKEIYESTLLQHLNQKEGQNRSLIAQPLCTCKMCLFLDLFIKIFLFHLTILCSCNNIVLL